MRFLSLLVIASVGLSACGLDIDGVADTSLLGDDGGGATNDATTNAALDANGAVDGTGSGDGANGNTDGTTGDDGGATDSPAGDGDAFVPDSPTDSPTDALDSGHDAADACVATTEVCTDGIDNDCDTLVDCADPDCAAFTCEPSAPTGWTFVEYSATTRPGCTSGYGSPTSLYEGASGSPDTCACNCSVDANNQGSCEHGTFTVHYNDTSSCPNGPLGVYQNDAHDGACTAFPALLQWPTSNNAKAQISTLPYTPGTCSLAPTKSKTEPTFTAQGQSCAVTSAGGGCSGGGACVPAATGFSMCLQKSGDQSCPPPGAPTFTNKHSDGTTVHDTRDCTTCGCSVTGQCQNSVLDLYLDSQCAADAGPPLALPADNKCNDENDSGHTYAAYAYSAQVQNVTCNDTGGQPTGSVSLDGITTTCCP